MSPNRGELRCLAVSAAAPCSEYQRQPIRRRLFRCNSAFGWLLVILLATGGVPAVPAAAEPEPVRTTDVMFVGGGGVILHGIVVAPRPSGKRRPALVMLEGAGNRGRQELQPAAEVFARHGVITLIYDKRKVGSGEQHGHRGRTAPRG
jgi:hypothetical protein